MFHLRENTRIGTRWLTPLGPRVSVLAVKSRSWAAIRVALPLWVAFSVCAAQAPSPQSASPTSSSGLAPFAGAMISEWRGPVRVQLPGGSAGHPAHGQVLPEGTVLDTQDGQLVLVLRSDESEVLLQPHTRLVLRAPQPGNWDTVQIILGKVRAYIRKRTGERLPSRWALLARLSPFAVRGSTSKSMPLA